LARLHHIGLRDAQILKGRLQAGVPEQGDLNRIVGAERACEERRHGVVSQPILGPILPPQNPLARARIDLSLHIGEAFVGAHRRATSNGDKQEENRG